MEASTVAYPARPGRIIGRGALLRLQGDERLVAAIRAGNERAFEVLFERYHSRLLAFCRGMLRSEADAEDILQDVFVNAHAAMLGDSREINVKPWLYRIARNRCLNQLRKPVASGLDSIDAHPDAYAKTTFEQVEMREQMRGLLSDVRALPETQRAALCLREIDQLSYAEIALALETTVPSVKSLLVRARIGLAESSEARLLSCDEVRVALAEAAEGLAKATGPVRKHVRNCESCGAFRAQLRSDRRSLAALAPIGPIVALHTVAAKLGFGGGASGAASGGGGAGAAGGAVGGGAFGGAVGGGAFGGAGGLGAICGAIGGKAAAGLVTATLLAAGAVEVHQRATSFPAPFPPSALSAPAASGRVDPADSAATRQADNPASAERVVKAKPIAAPTPEPTETAVEPIVEEPVVENPEAPPADDGAVAIDETPVEIGTGDETTGDDPGAGGNPPADDPNPTNLEDPDDPADDEAPIEPVGPDRPVGPIIDPIPNPGP